MTVRRIASAALAASVLGSWHPALAGDTTVEFQIANDRQPDDLGVSKDMKYLVGLAHGFDNGVVLGGSFQYTDARAGKPDSQNLEATLGYRLRLGDVFSINGSAGLGGRFTPLDDFAYYVLRVGADWELSKAITWNVVGYRYRNAFDTDNDYDTPEVSTALAFKIDAANSVTTTLYQGWKDGAKDETGIALGFKHAF
ncbi:MAG: outer membrane beta-barrel protein [Rhizobiaceae bacterium]|nr:outer membrane beta-barrel protein [Rhizobiaceae bacterium]